MAEEGDEELGVFEEVVLLEVELAEGVVELEDGVEETAVLQ